MEETASISSMVTTAWRFFITEGQPGDYPVSSEIIESWRRCYVNGVDPYDGTCYHLLSREESNTLLGIHENFINIARPFMLKLYEFVKGSGFIVVLTDKQGYILESFGDETTLDWAKKLNFVKGAKWTEEEVGTNAIGTALLLQKPIQTSGAEHYCRRHHIWTCSACPIFDRSGDMIGILDMSGPVDGTHLHTLGMVVAAVEAIMDQMRIQEKNRQLTMANMRMTNVFLTLSDGVIVINPQGVIVQINPIAQQIIGKSARTLTGHPIQKVLGKRVPALEKAIKRMEPYNDVEVMVDTAQGRIHCLSSGVPILDEEGTVSDVVIVVRPIEKVQKLVNRFSGAQATFHFKDIISRSPKMLEAIRLATLAAAGGSHILLEGESGTGKELFAQSIHNRSAYRKGPFVAVNCGAIPRELIGSELFGYAEGAFTGAKRGGRPGKFEMAAGGTLFLDEIGDMPLEQQVALLRVLQDKRITRIGDDKIIPVDFRLICATNKNLLEEVEKGNFRQDLYYRLNVVAIQVPPLRDRREDIPLLVKHFIEAIGRELTDTSIEITPEVMDSFMGYHWPGNVRELENVVERMVSMMEDGRIQTEHLPSYLFQDPQGAPAQEAQYPAVQPHSEREKKKQVQAQNERRLLINLLAKHGGNITAVAKEMKVSRNTVYRKMRLYNIGY